MVSRPTERVKIMKLTLPHYYLKHFLYINILTVYPNQFHSANEKHPRIKTIQSRQRLPHKKQLFKPYTSDALALKPFLKCENKATSRGRDS